MNELNANQKKVLAQIVKDKSSVKQRIYTRKAVQKNGEAKLYNNKTINSLVEKGYLKLDKRQSTPFEKVYKVAKK